jgi:hypothetical protein
MASDITIINGALRKLGVPRIGTRNEETEPARVANDTYDALRDAVLTDAPWDFATKRQELSANATAPLFGFDNAFDLPSDPYCLKPLEIVNLNEYQWSVEGRQIITSHDAPLQLIYIARITDVGSYSPQFVEALQSRLAAEWAEPLIKQSSVQQVMINAYDAKVRAAKTIEAGQTGLHEDTTDGSWVDSRLG